MKMQPKVSIVIPVFNGSDFLREAIDSALNQTYKDIEIIVVNDGSNDNGATERIALSYGDKVRYFFKKNGGVASALNTAITKMSGEYFSWLSHDDLYYPNKIELQIEALSSIGWGRTILYSDYEVFYGDNNYGNQVRLSDVPSEQFRYFITIKNSLHGCSLLIPKSAFVECGLFNEPLRTTQDYDLWFRMAEKFRFIHLPDVLVKARSHADQGSVKMKDTALKEINELLSGFVKQLSEAELVGATKKPLSISYAEIAASFRQRGFYNAAQCAENMALQSLKSANLVEALITRYVLFYGALVGGFLGCVRRILINLRMKIRRCLIF